MKICIIGGTGHIGMHLVRMFQEEGWSVVTVTSGRHPIPEGVTSVIRPYVRGDAEWGNVLREIGADVVVDILGTDVPSTYEAVKGTSRHLIACGSLWMYGEPKGVPTPEVTQGPCEFAGYALRYAELQEVLGRAQRDGVPFTAIMPPNICGPGKIPLEGMGGRSLDVHKAHQAGQPVPLPELGAVLIGPCDAEDVARGFFLSALQPQAAAGEIFNVGSAYALTARRFVEVYGEIYGSTIPIEWMSWKTYAEEISPDPGSNYHFRGHMCPDISKIRSALGYAPRYTPEETMARAVDWMRREGMI